MTRLQRYVSNELTHFVGASLDEPDQQFALLVRILQAGVLKVPGGSDYVATEGPSGPVIETTTSTSISSGKRLSSNEKYRASIVCFADIPVDDLSLHMRKYSLFGLSFSRGYLLGQGANPVFYVARQSSTDVRNPLANDSDNHDHLIELARRRRTQGHWENFTRADLFDEAELPLSRLVEAVFVDPLGNPEPPSVNDIVRSFLARHLFPFMKFYDASLPEEDLNNYYMEREWRVVGPVNFQLTDVERILTPRRYAPKLREDLPSYHGQLSFSD